MSKRNIPEIAIEPERYELQEAPLHHFELDRRDFFKLVGGGKEAVRTQVKLGRASVNTVEILGGLEPDEKVILSDMSAWDAFNRIRLD